MGVDCNRNCENCLSCTCIVDDRYPSDRSTTLRFDSPEERTRFEQDYCREEGWDF